MERQGDQQSTLMIVDLDQHVYDDAGNRVRTTDPLNHVTRYDYDAANRLTAVELPAGGMYEYRYNPAGRMTRIIDPNNHEVDMDHDALGRETNGVSATTTYDYDKVGNRRTMKDPDQYGGRRRRDQVHL